MDAWWYSFAMKLRKPCPIENHVPSLRKPCPITEVFWEKLLIWLQAVLFGINSPGQGRNQLFISGGAIFMKFYSMTSSCLFNRGTTFSQTVTYSLIVMYFCSQTRSPWYKHALYTQCWLIKTDKTERFATALETESPCQARFLTCDISDFTPYAHAQSNIIHIKYAEATDG